MPRGNVQNLKTPTTEEARDRGRKGGKKSGEVRAQRKLLKDELLSLLDKKIEGENSTARKAMSAALVAKAINGDTDAFKVIRDTIGEKPTETIKLGADEETIAKMDAFFDFLKDKRSK